MQLPEGEDVRFCPNCGALLVPQAVQVKVIIAEFHYWDYGEFSRTAMKPAQKSRQRKKRNSRSQKFIH